MSCKKKAITKESKLTPVTPVNFFQIDDAMRARNADHNPHIQAAQILDDFSRSYYGEYDECALVSNSNKNTRKKKGKRKKKRNNGKKISAKIIFHKD
jgi:hypothetical protein